MHYKWVAINFNSTGNSNRFIAYFFSKIRVTSIYLPQFLSTDFCAYFKMLFFYFRKGFVCFPRILSCFSLFMLKSLNKCTSNKDSAARSHNSPFQLCISLHNSALYSAYNNKKRKYRILFLIRFIFHKNNVSHKTNDF